jgi:hypothetical protein
VHGLHTQGVLSFAYLHLLSLRRFRPLVQRAGQWSLRDEAPAAGGAQEVANASADGPLATTA